MRRRLCSVILVVEAVVLGLVTPVLLATGATSTAVALSLGLGLCVLSVITAGLLRMPWAYWLGWALQFAAIGLGFIIGAMAILGVVFLALWVTAYRLGGMIDKDKAAAAAGPVSPAS